MIRTWGSVGGNITDQMIKVADTIKHLNYKTTTPAKFRKNYLTEDLAKDLMKEVSTIIGVDQTKLDYVYFSAAKGAEPHTDILPPEIFTPRTFIIPVILPTGKSVIIAEEDRVEANFGEIYEFDHEKIHSMELEDTESGCVVIMVAIKH